MLLLREELIFFLRKNFARLIVQSDGSNRVAHVCQSFPVCHAERVYRLESSGRQFGNGCPIAHGRRVGIFEFVTVKKCPRIHHHRKARSVFFVDKRRLTRSGIIVLDEFVPRFNRLEKNSLRPLVHVFDFCIGNFFDGRFLLSGNFSGGRDRLGGLCFIFFLLLFGGGRGLFGGRLFNRFGLGGRFGFGFRFGRCREFRLQHVVSFFADRAESI